VLSELTGHGQHVLQVGTAVLIGRRTYGREHHLDIVEHLGEVGGEVQAVVLHIAPNKLLKPGLIDGHDAILQLLNLGGVHVDTGDVGTHLGKTRAADQSYITGSYDCYFHTS